MTKLTIVPMLGDHLLQVHSIEKQVSQNPWAISQFEDSIVQHHSVVAKRGTVVAGYLVYSVVLDETEVLNIAVNPDFQRQGFAKQIVDYYLKALPDEVESIFLEVRRSNHPAINFYQGLGFQQSGCRKSYYPTSTGDFEDALLMQMSRS